MSTDKPPRVSLGPLVLGSQPLNEMVQLWEIKKAHNCVHKEAKLVYTRCYLNGQSSCKCQNSSYRIPVIVSVRLKCIL